MKKKAVDFDRSLSHHHTNRQQNQSGEEEGGSVKLETTDTQSVVQN
jgi:hypothetical protein